MNLIEEIKTQVENNLKQGALECINNSTLSDSLKLSAEVVDTNENNRN